MKRSVTFGHLFAALLILSPWCYAEEQTPPAETNRWVSVGMLWSVAESNIMASGGALTQMGWPTGAVYALRSGELIAVVGDGKKVNSAVSRILLCPCKPTVVTDWPEYKQYELKRIPAHRRVEPYVRGALKFVTERYKVTVQQTGTNSLSVIWESGAEKEFEIMKAKVKQEFGIDVTIGAIE